MGMLLVGAKALVFILMVLISLFLILIILIQRGKGGGLVGAFGGMGGGSMFGTKTTDVFLKITIWTTVVWFVFCFCSRYIIRINSGGGMLDQASASAPVATVPSDAQATTENTDAAAQPATEAQPAPAAEPANDAPAAAPAPASDPAPAADAPAQNAQ